jgi:hypothetical protein
LQGLIEVIDKIERNNQFLARCDCQSSKRFLPHSGHRNCNIHYYSVMSQRYGGALLIQASTFLSIFLLLASPLCHGSMLNEYFYVQDDLNTNIHHHYVQEYLATSGTKPNFLYDPTYPNGRIVEFYAHWCPHCQVRNKESQSSNGR